MKSLIIIKTTSGLNNILSKIKTTCIHLRDFKLKTCTY